VALHFLYFLSLFSSVFAFPVCFGPRLFLVGRFYPIVFVHLTCLIVCGQIVGVSKQSSVIGKEGHRLERIKGQICSVRCSSIDVSTWVR
jgi:hypothetical protein